LIYRKDGNILLAKNIYSGALTYEAARLRDEMFRLQKELEGMKK
jgi:hypothetical protein